jgi:hypothetical protein
MLKVKLVCPQCLKEQEWSETDFEDWVNCECGYGDEAWFFWHTLKQEIKIKRFNLGKKERLWVRSANYPNDALCLDEADFVNYAIGRGSGMCHGGSYTIKVWQADFNKDNPNYGTCDADMEFHLWRPEEADNKEAIGRLIEETAKFTTFLKDRELKKVNKK